MPRLCTLLIVCCATLTASASPQVQPFALRAKVIDVTIIPSTALTKPPRDYMQADFDAEFAVTMRVISMAPPLAGFARHHRVTFAIHSPELLFLTSHPEGMTYDLVVRPPRKTTAHLWSLDLRRERPNQAMQPTAAVPMRSYHCFMNATCKARGG